MDLLGIVSLVLRLGLATRCEIFVSGVLRVTKCACGAGGGPQPVVAPKGYGSEMSCSRRAPWHRGQ